MKKFKNIGRDIKGKKIKEIKSIVKITMTHQFSIKPRVVLGYFIWDNISKLFIFKSKDSWTNDKNKPSGFMAGLNEVIHSEMEVVEKNTEIEEALMLRSRANAHHGNLKIKDC